MPEGEPLGGASLEKVEEQPAPELTKNHPGHSLLRPGVTCWRHTRAERAALLVDMACYFAAAKAAMLKARYSIHLLNWAFDPTTYFHPEAGRTGPDSDQIGPFLRELACERPELDVRVLCWRSALPIAATQNFFPHRARKCFHGTPVKFQLDDEVPMGACHHQKLLIVDDQVAFCGGGDIGPDRWDTPEHLDDDPRRHKTEGKGKCFESRHEVMSVVDGGAALAAGDLFRRRWLKATGETVSQTEIVALRARDNDPWPECVEPDFTNVAVGLSRSEPKWRTSAPVREVESLHLAAIADAERCIYLENQYFTSPLIAEALAARLVEPNGPEIVLISTQHSPSWFDQMTMDRTRSMFLERLEAADAEGRLHAFSPVTEKGRTIIVHSKLAIVDDRLLRVGSANINNRSGGFDTECDLSIEPATEDARARLAQLRDGLIAHWLGVPVGDFEAARQAAAESVGQAIKAIRANGFDRLRPLRPQPIGRLATLIATFHLGDPSGPEDSWRPWRRRRHLQHQLRRRALELARIGLDSPAAELSPETI